MRDRSFQLEVQKKKHHRGMKGSSIKHDTMPVDKKKSKSIKK